MEISAGRLCRFKPRDKWPSALKQSIPKEKLYFIHPVIIVRGIVDGTVDVVTTTSTPALAANHKNYIRISTTNSRWPIDLNAPLIVNHKMPKDSWAVLDSKRQFPVTILEPWIEEGENFTIGHGSTKRLLQKVNEEMAAIARSTSALHATMAAATAVLVPGTVPPPQPPNPCVAASTNPWARAMAPPGPPPSVPLPALPSLPVPAPAPLSTLGKPPPPPQRTTSLPSAQPATPTVAKPLQLSLRTSPKSDNSVDIADIKQSLAGLKLAVAALEGLCEKLEAKAETTHTTQPPSLSPEPTARHPPPPRDDKAARMLGINSESVMATEKTAGTKMEGKTSRLRRWGSRIFMLKEG